MKMNVYKTIRVKSLAQSLYKNGLFLFGFILFMGLSPQVQGQTTNPSPYCNISDDCRFDPSITDVTFGSFSNNSGGCDNDGDVTYFNNLSPVTGTKGKTLSGTVVVDGSSFNDHGVGIWIDLNGDGQFSSNEQVYSNIIRNHSGTSTHNVSFKIPTNAQCGTTRMRIQGAEDAEPQPGDFCSMASRFGDGENEDYDIDIKAASSQPDVGVSGIVAPKAGKSSYGIENVTVKIANNSTQNVSKGTTIPVRVLTQNLTQPRKFNYTLQKDLNTCEVVNAKLGLMSLACVGTNTITAWTEWSQDVNNNNDTGSQFYQQTARELYTENFDRGSLGNQWTTSSSARVEAYSGCQGPYTGSNYLSLDEGNSSQGHAYAQTQIDLKGASNPLLQFWWANYDGVSSGGDCYSEDGVFVSVDGGATFVKIQTFCDINGSNWTQFKLNLKQELQDEGLSLPASGKIIIRFSQRDSFGRCSEGFGIDAITIFDNQPAAPAPKPGKLISGPDTAYINSPATFTTLSDNDENVWSLNGNQVALRSPSYTKTFRDTGSNKINLVQAGCFGLDTNQQLFEVVIPDNPPSANFIADKNYVDTNGVVQFADESLRGPTDWEWQIKPTKVNGNNAFTYIDNTNGTGPKPKVRFHESGEYDVTLIVKNRVGYDTLTRKAFIRVSDGYRICKEQSSSNASGFLYDPAGLGTYEDDQKRTCKFVITPNCADSVGLAVENMNIAGDQCRLGGIIDRLEVYDGTTTNGTALHKQKGFANGLYENNAPSPNDLITAESGSMLVVFKTNGCVSAEDFTLRWETYQSPDSGTKQSIMNNQITAPDSAYTGGFAGFSVTNHMDGNRYEWILPNGNSIVTDKPSRSVQIPSGLKAGSAEVQLVTSQCNFSDTASTNLFIKKPKQKPIVDFTASRTTFKVGDTIQLQELTKRGVNSWKWEFDPSSGLEFVKGTSAESRNPYVTATSSGNYRVDLIAGNDIGKKVEAKINFLEVNQSCQPVVSNTSSDFAINTFAVYEPGKGKVYENKTSLSSSGYSQFNAQSQVKFEAGKKYVIEISRNTAFNDFSHGIWLDMNNDGTFSSNERLASSDEDSTFTVKDTVVMPSGGIVGNLDLRVATNAANNPLNGCGPHFTGEFEDYTVEYLGDITAPDLTLKGDDTISVNLCSNVIDTGATAHDLVDGNLTSEIMIPNGEVINEPGMQKLMYTVEDEAGNQSTIHQIVNVGPDTSRPQITLRGDKQIDIPYGNTFMDPGYEAEDTCGDVAEVNVKGNVNTSVPGDYELTYIAKDFNGNQASVTRTVNVFDSIPPKASLSGRDSIFINVFSNYNDPGVISSDNYRDSTRVLIDGEVKTDKVGTYNLVYNVLDADSNLVRLNRVVIVEDNKAPNFTDLPEEVIKHDVNTRFNKPFDVSDNYYDASALSVQKSGSFFNNFPSGTPDSVGFFNARFTYEDGSGNEATATVGVQVVDRVDPTITLMDNRVVNLERWEVYEDSLGSTYEIDDNHYAESRLTVNITGSYFTEYIDSGRVTGLFQKRYQVMDPSGNKSAMKTRDINVISNTSGTGEVEGDIEFEVYPNPSQGIVNLDLNFDKQQAVKIDILDMQGQVVKEVADATSIKQESYNLNLSEVSAGAYQVRIQTSSDVYRKTLNIVK